MQRRRVAIVGGGITGLTTAYRLLTTARDAAGAPIAVTLLEERDRLGGNIQTDRVSGFLIDGGPDSFVVTRPQASALCKEIGLGDRLIPTTERNRRVYVLRGGALELLPEGLMLGVPTRILPMAQSRLFSWPAKARMALDLLIPRRAPGGDESIGHFIRRRLGDEAVERLAEPLLGGIYMGNVDTLSLRSTFPQLFDLEDKHRSLIVGALAQMAARGQVRGKPAASVFSSLLGGMSELIDTLAAKIERAGGELRLGARVTEVVAGSVTAGSPVGGPGPARFVVRSERATNGAREEIEVDDVVVCSPAYAAADAVDSLDREIAAKLRQIPYLSTATVVVGYHRADVPHPLDASGLLVPRREGRRAVAATFISSKWAARAPSDSVLLRIFVGGHRDAGALAQSDDELIALARVELEAMVGVRARPLLARVYRYARANAQPVVGHAARVQQIRALAARHPGLHFAGAAYDGVGIPDCIRQGSEVAARITAP